MWTLKEPYGLLIDTLAKTGTSIPFVMREKEAMVDPFQQIRRWSAPARSSSSATVGTAARRCTKFRTRAAQADLATPGARS